MYHQPEVRKVPNLAKLVAKDTKHGKCGQIFANCNCKKGGA